MISIDNIKISLQRALLGEVYKEIRGIAYVFDQKNKSFLIRYYLDREPTDFDFDSVSSMMAEFISFFKYSDFNEIKEECLYANCLQKELDPLSGFVYLRYEN